MYTAVAFCASPADSCAFQAAPGMGEILRWFVEERCMSPDSGGPVAAPLFVASIWLVTATLVPPLRKRPTLSNGIALALVWCTALVMQCRW